MRAQKDLLVVLNADAMQYSSTNSLFAFSSIASFVRPFAIPDDAIGWLLPVSLDSCDVITLPHYPAMAAKIVRIPGHIVSARPITLVRWLDYAYSSY
jgi:hypothetical protein